MYLLKVHNALCKAPDTGATCFLLCRNQIEVS